MTTSDHISVAKRNLANQIKDTSTVQPSCALGRTYVIATAKPQLPHRTALIFVALDDKTIVRVTIPPYDVTGRNASILYSNRIYSNGESFQFVLSCFETFQLSSDSDLTGVRVESDHDFSLHLSGCDVVASEQDGGLETLNCVEEQLVPVRAWGTQHVTGLLSRMSSINTPFNLIEAIRVVAAHDNTQVTLQTSAQDYHINFRLDAGQDQELSTSGDVGVLHSNISYIIVLSSKPIAVLQYYLLDSSRSCCERTPHCDCAPLTVAALNHARHEYLFVLPSNSYVSRTAVASSYNDKDDLFATTNTPTVGRNVINREEVLVLLEAPHVNGLVINDESVMSQVRSDVTVVAVAQRHWTLVHLNVSQDTLLRLSHSDNDATLLVISRHVIHTDPCAQEAHDVMTIDDDDVSASSASLETDVIAVIATLVSAIILVGVCILGFVLYELSIDRRCAAKLRCCCPVGSVEPYPLIT